MKEPTCSWSTRKTTVIIGSANVVSRGIRLIRMNAFELLLVPYGIGLLRHYDLILTPPQPSAVDHVGISGARQNPIACVIMVHVTY